MTKQKIAEKEAAEQAKAERRAAQAELDADPVERRRREQAQLMAADLENANALFGGMKMSGAFGR